jgi:uncharacterized LabA/DUF88 family protein
MSQTTKTKNHVFIDGQNVETGLRNNSLSLDFQAFFDYLKVEYKVDKIFYCVKFNKNKERLVFFQDLEKIGYNLIFSSGVGNSRADGSHKVNVDADLIVYAMQEYYSIQKFGLILVSGDGDFVPLIRFFEEEKQFVKIITPDKDSTSNMLSFDRYTKTKRFLTYINPDLQNYIQKIISP